MRIKKVPADATRQQLVLLMEQVTGERVVDVVIASDSNSSTSLLVRRRSACRVCRALHLTLTCCVQASDSSDSDDDGPPGGGRVQPAAREERSCVVM